MAFIYHLAKPSDWEKALEKGSYEHISLQAEGFIHCSTKEQLLPTANIHFKDEQELVVLFISERLVKGTLKWEESRNGELFPHIYGKIQLKHVENTRILFKDKEGKWEWD